MRVRGGHAAAETPSGRGPRWPRRRRRSTRRRAGRSAASPSSLSAADPVYLDCRRDLDATVDDDLLADLGRPLGVLDSARWLCGQVADVAEEGLVTIHRQLAATRAEVTLSDLYLAAADLLEPALAGPSPTSCRTSSCAGRVLGSGGPGPVRVAAADARRLADALFPTPGAPGPRPGCTVRTCCCAGGPTGRCGGCWASCTSR